MAKEKAPKENKQKTKQQKFATVTGIVILILLVITIGARLAISPHSPLYRNYALMIMPNSVDTVFEDKDLTLYIEKNKKFDDSKNQPLEAFSVYYYEDNDSSKDKIYLKNGSTLKGEKEESNLMVLQFLGNATITDSIIKNVLSKIFIVLCILLACWLIYIWYLSWCAREDRKKALNQQFN